MDYISGWRVDWEKGTAILRDRSGIVLRAMNCLILKMEVVQSFETYINIYQSKRRNIPARLHLRSLRFLKTILLVFPHYNKTNLPKKKVFSSIIY
jgi:hypothetical protein